MPCIKVKCPLCSELVTDNCLGGHLLSKAHAEDILNKNDKLKDFLQALKTNCHLTRGKGSPPLFFLSNSSSYHICLSCKKCYKDGENNTGASKHYEKNPKCKDDGVAKLEAFLSPVVKTTGANKDAMEKIAKLEKDLKYYKEACERIKKKSENISLEADELKEIIKMAIDSKFDINADGNINEFKKYLEADLGNQGFYMGRFKYEEEDF